MGIEYRQKQQLDPRRRRRGGEAGRHFANIGIRRAIGRMMKIMKFGHGGETAFEHLDKGQSGGGFQIFR
jgi:hypothetical protein